MYKQLTVLSSIAVVGGLAACGSTPKAARPAGTSASAPAVSSTPAPVPVTVAVTTPSDGATVRSANVRLEGTVTPAAATVTVNGRRAPVRGGHWVKVVRGLDRGENTITVEGSLAGREPASVTSSVVRKRSAAEIAAAVQARRERARRRAEAKRVRRQQEEATFRAGAKRLDYAQLVKNPERYTGTHVVFSGPILQIRDEGGSGFTLLQTSCDEFDICDDLVLVEFERSVRSAADDRVTVYGTITGGEEYDTAAGGSNFVPKMHLRYIDE